jgi:hypothetical protein
MKTKDIGLIVVIAIISGALSIVLSSLLIPSADKSQSVETVGAINSEFQRPPTEYFNQDSVNPTQEITIGEDANSKPFQEN